MPDKYLSIRPAPLKWMVSVVQLLIIDSILDVVVVVVVVPYVVLIFVPVQLDDFVVVEVMFRTV